MGGMETALSLWERCVIPSLLHGCGNWIGIKKTVVQRLNNVQRWFLRILFRIGKGVPLAALTWETGLIDMEYRIWMEKIK